MNVRVNAVESSVAEWIGERYSTFYSEREKMLAEGRRTDQNRGE